MYHASRYFSTTELRPKNIFGIPQYFSWGGKISNSTLLIIIYYRNDIYLFFVKHDIYINFIMYIYLILFSINIPTTQHRLYTHYSVLRIEFWKLVKNHCLYFIGIVPTLQIETRRLSFKGIILFYQFNITLLLTLIRNFTFKKKK